MSKITHILPDNEVSLHICSDRCKCMPVLGYKLGKMIYQHRSIVVKLTRKDELLEEIKDRFN